MNADTTTNWTKKKRWAKIVLNIEKKLSKLHEINLMKIQPAQKTQKSIHKIVDQFFSSSRICLDKKSNYLWKLMNLMSTENWGEFIAGVNKHRDIKRILLWYGFTFLTQVLATNQSIKPGGSFQLFSPKISVLCTLKLNGKLNVWLNW